MKLRIVVVSIIATLIATSSVQATDYRPPFYAGSQCFWGGPIFLFEDEGLSDNYEFGQSNVWVWAIYQGKNTGFIYSLAHHYQMDVTDGKYMAFFNSLPLANDTYVISYGYLSTPDVPYLLLASSSIGAEFIYDCNPVIDLYFPVVEKAPVL